MFISLAFITLAATPADAAFQEYLQRNGALVLAESLSNTHVVAYKTPYSQDAKARQWDLWDGQLRSAYGRCGYPHVCA